MVQALIDHTDVTEENGEQIRRISTWGLHKTNLKVLFALKYLEFMLSARVCGTGNKHDKE